MKWQRVVEIAGVVGAVAAVLALVHAVAINWKPSNQNTSAAQIITFYCGLSHDGVPTTLAQTPRGKVPVIRWVSDDFSASGYDPHRRCEDVSNKFQEYQNQGILSYITTGIENRLEVICVSSKDGGSCSGTLFTLKQGESASRVIQQLFDVAYYGSGPLEEGSGSQIYVDVKKLLENAPDEGK